MALSENEAMERERLLQLQSNNQRYFSQEEFDRLTYLSKKMFNNATAGYSADSIKFKGFNPTDNTVKNRNK